jgi:hypothetical protein
VNIYVSLEQKNILTHSKKNANNKLTIEKKMIKEPFHNQGALLPKNAWRLPFLLRTL